MKDVDVTSGEGWRGEPPGSTASSLIKGVNSGAGESWERLVSLYGPVVYGWARRAGLQQDDAADVTQDVFRALHLGIHRFRRTEPGQSFRGWLWTVTRNKVRDLWRRQANRPAAVGGSDAYQRLLAVPDSMESSESSPPPSGLLPRAVELVRPEFEEKTWQAFWRVTADGAAPADVAEELGLTANAVYIARSRVLRRLREVISEGG